MIWRVPIKSWDLEYRSAGTSVQADTGSPTELKKKRAFRKFSYRGIDLDQYAPIKAP